MTGEEMMEWLESDESLHEHKSKKLVEWKGIPALPYFSYQSHRAYVVSRQDIVNQLAVISHQKTMKELGQ